MPGRHNMATVKTDEITDTLFENSVLDASQASEISLKTFSVGAEDEVEPNKAMTFNII